MNGISLLINALGLVVNLASGSWLLIMGMDWLTIGYGLNPWLAFPGAFGCAMGATWFAFQLQQLWLDWQEYNTLEDLRAQGMVHLD